ncbi:MAG: tape measure protein [Treponema sp.]|nr:tape measure protein [Treponema sp.]
MSNDKTLELQIRIAAEEAARIVSALKGEIKDLSDEAGKFSKNEGAKLKNSFKEAETAAKDTVTSIGDIKNALGSLAEVVVATKALSFIKDMGIFALETADNFQSMKNQFGILLGDMEAGAGLFNEIKAFNDVTPFDLDTLTQATNVLVAAKVPLQDLRSQLTRFGDLSQGNSQRLTSYVNAFSQAAAKGKADMQILNTYLNQGVPILDALANNFGVTTAEIAEMSSQGKISFADFSAALEDLTAAGGQYFGGMELSSQSLTAMQEGLKEATNSLAASYGEIFIPAAIAVVKVLTDITNAINESPIVKGLLTGALIALTGYLSAMAVKAGVAFVAQMKLNLAVGALNPVVLASTLAVAGLAAGYTAMTAKNQEAAKEAEKNAFAQRNLADAIKEAATAMESYTQQYKNMNNNDRAESIREASMAVNEYQMELYKLKTRLDELNNITRGSVTETYIGGIEGYFAIIAEREEEIKKLEDDINKIGGLLQIAQTNLRAHNQGLRNVQQDILNNEAIFSREWRNKLLSETEAIENEKQQAINKLQRNAQEAFGVSWERNTAYQDELRALNTFFYNKQADLTKASREAAGKWKESWDEIWNQFEAEQNENNFYNVDLEYSIRLNEADAFGANETIINQINEYYEAQRQKIIDDLSEKEARKRKELADEEARIAEEAASKLKENIEKEGSLRRMFNRSRIDDIEHEMQTALDAIKEIEDYRISAAEDSEEQIAEIKKHYAQMRDEAHLYFKIKIDTATLQEARESVKNWENELSDSLLRTFMNIEGLAESAAVVISDLTSQLIQLSASAALKGFEELGRALGKGQDAAESMSQALAQMARQILNQLPMMFLQAGLQLIANGQWPIGLAFIAAAGSAAIMSGYVSGVESQNAQDGKTAKAYAAGGAFTNQIISAPTYFAHGGGFGLMGEAGPEAIMPLTRMSNGNLGVQTAGGDSEVNVIINNYSGENVYQKESTNENGARELEIFIGEAINKHLASGKADRPMARYNLRHMGV